MASAIISTNLLAVVLLIAGSVSAAPPTGFLPGEVSRAREHVRRIYPLAEKISEFRIALGDSGQPEGCSGAWEESEMTILVPTRHDSVLGYAVLDNVRGKDQLITYMLAVATDLLVTDLEILTYREPYGYEVEYETWQKQFLGRRPGEQLRPGREIRNISGATISVRSVTYGVRKILCTLAHLKDRLPR